MIYLIILLGFLVQLYEMYLGLKISFNCLIENRKPSLNESNKITIGLTGLIVLPTSLWVFSYDENHGYDYWLYWSVLITMTSIGAFIAGYFKVLERVSVGAVKPGTTILYSLICTGIVVFLLSKTSNVLSEHDPEAMQRYLQSDKGMADQRSWDSFINAEKAKYPQNY
jgi:hypothetical protein